MSTIARVEVIDHGVDHSQYFPGCGVVFTNFDACVTGIGDDFGEAIEDALEDIGSSVGDSEQVEAIERACREYLDLKDGASWPESDSVTKELARQGVEDPEECELYYHVSIRYSIAEAE